MKESAHFLKALAFGFMGGACFYGLGLPLQWLLGSLLATMCLSLGGVRLQVSKSVRSKIIVLIGLMVGSTFSPDIVPHLHQWVPTLLAMVGFTACLALFAYGYCRFVMKMSPLSAMMSGLPGGLSEMTVLADDVGADARSMTLVHAARVVCVLFSIPVFLTYAYDLEKFADDTIPTVWGVQDGVFLLCAGALGLYGAKICRLPSYKMMGPLVASAALHMSGVIVSEPSELLSSAVQLILGTSLGSRYASMPLRTVGVVLLHSFGLAALVVAITFAVAYSLHLLLGLSFGALLLALAPGGFAEMILAALSLGVDPAFVTTHHAVRLFAIILLGPLVVKAMLRSSRDE